MQLIFFNFANYSPWIAMPLKVSKEITCKWQNQRLETNKYVSWALFLKLQAADINFEKTVGLNSFQKWVSNLVNSQCLLALPTQSLYYTSLMGAPPYLQPMLVTSFYRFTRWHCTYGWPTLSAPYVGWLYLQNQWVTPHLWVCSFKCSVCLLCLLTYLVRINLCVRHLKWSLSL